jgi:hypothetical protein
LDATPTYTASFDATTNTELFFGVLKYLFHFLAQAHHYLAICRLRLKGTFRFKYTSPNLPDIDL